MAPDDGVDADGSATTRVPGPERAERGLLRHLRRAAGRPELDRLAIAVADALQHGGIGFTYWPYLTTGHFAEATFENWESEFLQMGAFVLLTVFLVQKGSGESNQDHDDPRDDHPR